MMSDVLASSTGSVSFFFPPPFFLGAMVTDTAAGRWRVPNAPPSNLVLRGARLRSLWFRFRFQRESGFFGCTFRASLFAWKQKMVDFLA